MEVFAEININTDPENLKVFANITMTPINWVGGRKWSNLYHCTKNEVFHEEFPQKMWPNPQGIADFVTFTEEILNGKLHFFVQWPSLAFLKLSNLLLRFFFSEAVNFGLLNFMKMDFRKDKFKNSIHVDLQNLVLTHSFPVHPFSFSWKTVFRCFYGVEKGCIRNKRVKHLATFHENTRERVLLFFISTYFILAFVT